MRLATPFSMKCVTCGEYIGRGRRFNGRKESPPNEHYLNIQIFFFHIRCTRCSSPITFRTDPKNNTYAMVSGAFRNIEPWCDGKTEETDSQRLDRLQAGEGDQEVGMADLIQSLEQKTQDLERVIAVADALDAIRTKNAAVARISRQSCFETVTPPRKTQAEEQDQQDAEEACRAFQKRRDEVIGEITEDEVEGHVGGNKSLGGTESFKPTRLTSYTRRKKKKDYVASLGVKAKKPS